MDLERWISLASRVLFSSAFALLGLALVERTANAVGYTILRGIFGGGRLLEIAAIFLIFVIAIQLREVKVELRRLRS
jgi:hypothetical protein